MKKIRERNIEKHLIAVVKKHGGEVRKVKWLGRAHAPDRLVLLKQGHFYVELKAPKKKLRAGQSREHARLILYGVPVFTLDTVEKIDKLIGALAS